MGSHPPPPPPVLSLRRAQEGRGHGGNKKPENVSVWAQGVDALLISQ